MKALKDSKRRILIVEDYPGMYRSLTYLISYESGLEVSGIASNVRNALKTIEKQIFDLAIVDISLDGPSGLELVRTIKSRWPAIAVMIYSSHDELSYVDSALHFGARGLLVKSADSTEEILTAIRSVLSGKGYISRGIRQALSTIGETSVAWAGGGDPV